MSDTASMRLAFDTVGARFGGTAVVAREVVAASLRCPGVDHVTVFATARPARQFDFPTDSRLEVVEHGRIVSSGPARVPWQLAGLGRSAMARRADLVIGLSNGGAGAGLPSAMFVQQALPFAPDVLRDEPLVVRARMRMILGLMRASARNAVAIGVQTCAMRDAVVKGLGVPPARVHVFMPSAPELPAAAENGPAIAAIERVPRGRRVLYVGSDLPYKNLDLAVEATERAGATLLATADRNSVIALPNLSRAELRAAYERADVLVMPSRIESLGLPLLEAMRSGLAIVSVDRPYAREVCGDAAVYAEDESAAALARALEQVLGDSGQRAALVAAGRKRVANLERQRPYEAMIRTFVHAAGLRGVEYL